LWWLKDQVLPAEIKFMLSEDKRTKEGDKKLLFKNCPSSSYPYDEGLFNTAPLAERIMACVRDGHEELRMLASQVLIPEQCCLQ